MLVDYCGGWVWGRSSSFRYLSRWGTVGVGVVVPDMVVIVNEVGGDEGALGTREFDRGGFTVWGVEKIGAIFP